MKITYLIFEACSKWETGGRLEDSGASCPLDTGAPFLFIGEKRKQYLAYTVGLRLHHVREKEDWEVLKRTLDNLSFLSVCSLEKTVGYLS